MPGAAPRRLREGLGGPPGPGRDRRHAGRPLRRPAPGPRGDQPAGLLAALPRPGRRCARLGPDAGDDGPLDAHDCRRRRRRPLALRPTAPAEAQVAPAGEETPCDVRGARCSGWADARRRGWCTCSAPRLGAHAAGHDGGVRRQPHRARTAPSRARLALGIGTSEVGHVLATQCLLQRRAADAGGAGRRGGSRAGVGAKDVVLAIIARLGVGGGTGARHRVHSARRCAPSPWRGG